MATRAAQIPSFGNCCPRYTSCCLAGWLYTPSYLQWMAGTTSDWSISSRCANDSEPRFLRFASS